MNGLIMYIKLSNNAGIVNESGRGLVHLKLIDLERKEKWILCDVSCAGPICILWMVGSAKRQLCFNSMKYKQDIYYVKQCIALI